MIPELAILLLLVAVGSLIVGLLAIRSFYFDGDYLPDYLTISMITFMMILVIIGMFQLIQEMWFH